MSNCAKARQYLSNAAYSLKLYGVSDDEAVQAMWQILAMAYKQDEGQTFIADAELTWGLRISTQPKEETTC